MNTAELLKEYKDLPRNYQQEVEDFIFFLKSKLLSKKTGKTEKKPRILGEGNNAGIWISPDFDEPLEDMKEYME